jgi:large subunit ribosomal protein L23
VVNPSSYTNNASIDIVKYPLITDKATRLLEKNQYSFIVDPSADKISIKKSIEYLFNVNVIKILVIFQKSKNVSVNLLAGNHIIKKR